MMKLFKKKEGFTLIELMIVVVIIGILAAIAIPQFMKYQLKSKSSEASRNLTNIRTTQEAFGAKYNRYVPGTITRSGVATSMSDKDAYTADASLSYLGYQPAGKIYFNYIVTAVSGGGNVTNIDSEDIITGGVPISTGRVDISISAAGDVDADGASVQYSMNDESQQLIFSPFGAGTQAGEDIF